MAYSVLTEPVIPVLWLDGTSSSIGIRETFLRAHEIRDIQGETPLERYALLRLLIAFAMDMLHPRNSYERRDLLDAGQFDQEVFDQYVALCEKDGPCFDLFDSEHPFMQSRYDEKLDKELKPVANLFPTLPTGHNHIFIDHRFEKNHVIPPARALGALCTIYLFCFAVGAKGYPSSINNTPPLYVTIIGKNLFETIILNMISIKEASPIEFGLGMVPWRTDGIVHSKKKFANVSLIEGFTWMPRRITLRYCDDGFIHDMYIQQGHDFQGNDLWKDPHVPYTKDQNVFFPVRPVLGKQLWRDVSSLIYTEEKENNPFIVYRYTKLMEDELPLNIPVRMLGLVMDNGKYFTWYEDDLSIPMFILKNEKAAVLLRNDVAFIEKICKIMFQAVQSSVDKPRIKSKTKEHEISTQCQQHFLHAAHDLLFGSAMDEIIGNVPEKEHTEHFCDAVKGLIQETIHQVLHASGTDTKAMMQQMEAEKWIWISWSKITEERMKGYAGS